MNLAQDRFFGPWQKVRRFQLFDGPDALVYDTPVMWWGYNTTDGKVYHVERRESDGLVTFHTCFGFAAEPNKIHLAVLEKYGIERKECHA